MNATIILMTRYPETGMAKTRLIPELGAEGACNLHKAMTEFCLSEALGLNAQVQVHFSGGTIEKIQQWLNPIKNIKQPNNIAKYIPQTNGDLGDKLYAAISHAQNTNHNHKHKVIIIGSDCPNNRLGNLENALKLLNNYDCVLGPSMDGGYYLIAFALPKDNANFLCTKIKPLFENITWGTSSVFNQTIEKIRQSSLNYALLPRLSDVDLPHDIPVKISIIIPCLNENENLRKLFTTLPSSFNTEFIVCDALENDNSKDVAARFGAIHLQSQKGRSSQIIAATQRASGEILLFLHADSILPKHWDISIRQVMQNQCISLGYFKFGITENFFTRRIIEWGTNSIRCRYFKLPFGDQGLFVRTKDFKHWNLPPVPILEDVFLVKKARHYGKTLGLPDILYTSGRRWLKHGIIRTSIMNWCILLCAKCGMDLEKIKQAYVEGKNPIYCYLQDNYIKK